MKYVCLVYWNDTYWDTASPAEADAMREENRAFDDELKSSGQLLYAQALQSVQTATTVRVRNGRATTQDGPFTETKEVLGGFILIEARDLNEAIQVATRMPSARVGSVEVRPVLEM